MTNQEKWNEIVKIFNENYTRKEECIQRLWENIFSEYFDYSRLKNEIDTHRSIRLGSSDRVIPDIIIKKDNRDIFITELKQFNIVLDRRYESQLFSYLKQIKCNIGILICNKIYIYDYDYIKEDTDQNVCEISFEKDNEDGIKFVELFSKNLFDKSKIQEFVKSKVLKVNNIKAIKNKINEEYVLNLIKTDLSKTYTADEIKEGMKDIKINVVENSYNSTLFAKNIDKSNFSQNAYTPPVILDDSLVRLENEKIQDYIKRILLIFERDKLLTEPEIINLQNKEYCKQFFGIPYALFVDNEKDTFISGQHRYWQTWPSKNIKYLNKFYVCSQWELGKDAMYENLITNWINKVKNLKK